MPARFEHDFSVKDFKGELEKHGNNLEELPGWMFDDLLLYTGQQLADDASLIDNDPDSRMKQAYDTARFAGARLTNDLKEGVTHVLVGQDGSVTRSLRQAVSK